MYSLIITLISIALISAFAISSAYYLSDIYEEKITESLATQLINESEQIENALLAFSINEGRSTVVQTCEDPLDTTCEPLQELIDKGYLASTPSDEGTQTKWSVAVISTADGVDTKALVKTVDYKECYRSNLMKGFNIAGSGLVAAKDPDTNLDSDRVPVCQDDMNTSVVCCSSI